MDRRKCKHFVKLLTSMREKPNLTNAVEIYHYAIGSSYDDLIKKDPDFVYKYYDLIVITKLKMLEIDKILKCDLTICDEKRGNFILKNRNIIFKFVDGVMNNLCMYSEPLSEIWKKKRKNLEWLMLIRF